MEWVKALDGTVVGLDTSPLIYLIGCVTVIKGSLIVTGRFYWARVIL